MPVKKADIPKAVAAKATATLTAKQFIAALKAHQSDTELKKIQRYFNQAKVSMAQKTSSWASKWDSCSA